MQRREQEALEVEKENVIHGCQPDTNDKDRRILFELTGRRLMPKDFPVEDETSQEEDDSVLLDNILGFSEVNEDDDEQLAKK